MPPTLSSPRKSPSINFLESEINGSLRLRKGRRCAVVQGRFPVPALTEQQKLVLHLEQVRNEAIRLDRALTEQSTALERLPAALLREASIAPPDKTLMAKKTKKLSSQSSVNSAVKAKAADNAEATEALKTELKGLRKDKPDSPKVAKLTENLAVLEKETRELLAQAQEIEFAIYDLKAVNPNAKNEEDTRTPTELLEVIASKGREADEALAELRHLLGSGTVAPEANASGLKVAESGPI